jgi:hypothetical protein
VRRVMLKKMMKWRRRRTTKMIAKNHRRCLVLREDTI